MNAQDIIQALERWGFQIHHSPEQELDATLSDINSAHDLGYEVEEIERDAPLILAWLRDPTIIDPDHDDCEAWIRKHHG